MLTSSIKSISDFSSAAGDVRLQIAVTRAQGRPRGPVTSVEREGLSTIRHLVTLGARFGPSADGNLEVTGSTPEQVDLAVKLGDLLPAAEEIREWSSRADKILGQFEQAPQWEQFEPDDRDFINSELEPFLVQLLNVADEDDDE